MTLKQYLFLMSLGSILCWSAWILVVNSVNPDSAGWWGITFFYLSLSLAITGTFSVAGFLLRRALIKNDELVFRHVRRTFRQSITLSLLTIMILIFQAAGWLKWWNLSLLIALFLVLEAVMFTKRRFSNSDYVK